MAWWIRPARLRSPSCLCRDNAHAELPPPVAHRAAASATPSQRSANLRVRYPGDDRTTESTYGLSSAARKSSARATIDPVPAFLKDGNESESRRPCPCESAAKELDRAVAESTRAPTPRSPQPLESRGPRNMDSFHRGWQPPFPWLSRSRPGTPARDAQYAGF